MSSNQDEIEQQAQLNAVAKEFELIKKEINKIDIKAKEGREKLLIRGFEIQGVMNYVREVYGLTPTALIREQVESYVKKNIDDTYRETLKQFVLDNMTDNLIAVDIVEKFKLNEPDREKAQAVTYKSQA